MQQFGRADAVQNVDARSVFFHCLPTSSGSASPAEMHRRSRSMTFGLVPSNLRVHRGIKRWHGAENGRPRRSITAVTLSGDGRPEAGPSSRRPTSERSSRCRAHRRRTFWRRKRRRRRSRCSAPARVGVGGEFQAGMDVAHALRPGRSIRTNKARTRIHPRWPPAWRAFRMRRVPRQTRRFCRRCAAWRYFPRACRRKKKKKRRQRLACRGRSQKPLANMGCGPG